MISTTLVLIFSRRDEPVSTAVTIPFEKFLSLPWVWYLASHACCFLLEQHSFCPNIRKLIQRSMNWRNSYVFNPHKWLLPLWCVPSCNLQKKPRYLVNTFFHDSRIILKTDLDEEGWITTGIGEFRGAKIQSIWSSVFVIRSYELERNRQKNWKSYFFSQKNTEKASFWLMLKLEILAPVTSTPLLSIFYRKN